MDELKQPGSTFKVVHILYSGLGGHGSVFFSLVRGDKNKEVSTAALFYGIEEIRSDYVTKCKELNVPFDFIRKKPGFDIRSVFNVIKSLRKTKPRVIVLHGTSFAIVLIKYYKLFNSKVRIIVRDTQAHHLKSKNEWIWLKKCIQWADKLVFLTKESLDGVRQRMPSGSLDRKAVIISNALDTELYKSGRLSRTKSEVIIGMQSRLQRIKDYPTLIRAFYLLKTAENKDVAVKLRIAGDGETRKELENLVESLGLSQSVEFCGMLNETELLTFMRSLDIYVHSTMGESMSNSIMQALSFGLPVIASNVWGVNNMITHNENGLLYTSGNELQLAEFMTYFVQDENKRESFGIRAREYAEKEYSLSRLFNNYRKIYE